MVKLMRYVTFYTELLARNTYLDKEVETFLKELENKTDKPKVKKYIKSNIRRYLINDFKANKLTKAPVNAPQWLKDSITKGEEVFTLDLSSKDKQVFNHWIDYLNTLPENKDLSKISIPQLITHVKEWEESFAKNKADEEDGIEDIHIYNNKFKWVKVFGKNSLNREGNLMNHCVGSYYNKVSKGDTIIFSLRDSNNRPHVTIELTNNRIEQIKGKNNEPALKYIKYIVDFLEEEYVSFRSINNNELKQYCLIDSDYGLIDLNNLPKNAKLHSLNLELKDYKLTNDLPEGLTIGSLDLRFSNITKLPKNLTVRTLDIQYSKIEELPEGLTVRRHILLDKERILKLGDNITINSNLKLDESRITSLPKNLKVKGTLDLRYTKISEIPDGTEVGMDLLLDNSYISKLPDNLKIKGTLSIYGCTNLTRLPKGLHAGMLSISKTKITELPEDLIVDTTLFMRNTSIKNIPKNLKVGSIER